MPMLKATEDDIHGSSLLLIVRLSETTPAAAWNAIAAITLPEDCLPTL